MRGARVITLVLALWLAGCSAPQETGGVVMSAKPMAVKLTAEIKIAGKRLELDYRLINETGGDLCVFNKFYRTKVSGERVLAENLAYVLFEEPATIHVTRSLIRIPLGLKVEYPEVPYVTILPAGESLAEKVLVTVPVLERHPYRKPLDPDNGQPRSFQQVYFSLGVIPRSAEIKLRPLPQAGEGIFALSYTDAAHGQYLIKTAPVKLTVAGLTAK